MLGLPKATEYNKRIPKQKFYENLNVSSFLRKEMTQKIQNIYWRNKLAETTINVAKGNQVEELEVFEIQLKEPDLDEKVLKQIDREIPYHILFVLTHEEKKQVWIGYKESASSGKQAFKVNQYFHTEWLEESEMSLEVEGLDMDKVYENFVKQIGGSVLHSDGQETLKESVARNIRRKEIEKQIMIRQQKIRKEKQLNKQVYLNQELKLLKKELEELK